MLEGIRIVASVILEKVNPSSEEAFGILLPQVWKSLVAAGADKTNDPLSPNPGLLVGGSTYEFANMFMFIRKLVYNLDKNEKIVGVDGATALVYTNWDEMFAQGFLQVLMGRNIGKEFLGDPDPTIMPINQEKVKGRYAG